MKQKNFELILDIMNIVTNYTKKGIVTSKEGVSCVSDAWRIYLEECPYDEVFFELISEMNLNIIDLVFERGKKHTDNKGK